MRGCLRKSVSCKRNVASNIFKDEGRKKPKKLSKSREGNCPHYFQVTNLYIVAKFGSFSYQFMLAYLVKYLAVFPDG